MKKILATTLLFFGIQSVTFGQGATVTLGPEMKDVKKSGLITNIIGKDNDGVYINRAITKVIIAIAKSIYTIESYNLNFEKTNSAILEKKEKEKGITHNHLFEINLKNKLYSVDTKKDLNNKTKTFTVEEINKTSLLPEGNEKTLAEYSFEDGNKRNSGNFGFNQSYDSSKVLIYYALPEIKDQPQKFGMQVYNDDFKEVWKKEIELPYNDELCDIVDYRVGNDGNVYLLAKVYEEKHNEKKQGEVNYKFHVFYYSKNDKDTYDMPIDSKSKFFNEMTLSINNNNEVVCVGLYSSENQIYYSTNPSTKRDKNEGTFYLRIDSKTHKVVAETMKPFSELMQEDEDNNDSDKKKQRKQDRIFMNYDFRNIIHKEDGGVIVVAEQFYIHTVTTTTRSSSGVTTTKTTFYYHYNNILVLNIDKNGKYIWQKFIPKKQVSTDDGGYLLSFALLPKGDNLYFFYNTTPFKKTKSGEETKRPIRREGMGVLSMYVLNKDGELSERQDLINKKESKVYMVPKGALQVSDNEIIFYGTTTKLNRLAKITIN